MAKNGTDTYLAAITIPSPWPRRVPYRLAPHDTRSPLVPALSRLTKRALLTAHKLLTPAK
jgi:hypothetical protein